MRKAIVLLALSFAASLPGRADFLAYTTLGHNSENQLTSDSSVDYIADPICPLCSYQMSGDHKINWTIGNQTIDVMQWGVQTLHYRGRLVTAGNPGSCYTAANTGTVLVMSYNGVPVPPYTLASGGPWAAETDCIPVAGPPCTSCACSISYCEQSESCPLILDLNGDGIHTTGLDDPLHFWIDLQGRNEATAWTNPNTEEAFLWMDLDNDHVAQVTELFGSRMVARDGSYHVHGFDALGRYDGPDYGGDGDGRITQKDWVWARLKLWVDRNHDGISQPTEISVPSSHGIVALNVHPLDGDEYDENGNELYLVGTYVVRTSRNGTTERLMADVEFRFIPNQ